MSHHLVPTPETFGINLLAAGVGDDYIVNLRAPPFGLLAAHAAASAVEFEADVAFGPGGQPLAMPRSTSTLIRIVLDLEHVPQYQFDQYARIVAKIAANDFFDDTDFYTRISPIGLDTWEADKWALVSTTDGWRQDSTGRWSGRVELMRRGTVDI